MNNHDLFHSLQQISRKLTKNLNETLEPFGLYSSQWSVLYVLHTKGILTQKQLCDYLSVEAPPMTRTIQRLLKQGLVEQVQGEDRRAKYIQLTAKSIEEYPSWEHAVLEMNKKLISQFPLELQKELLLLINKWLHTFSEK
ncbi:MarR family winged helix-turn-helix transcriptional regulator [Litchfieldia salsa]|uniref:DNA-binding transcriptional regulator, MarR family n=1 Tax=Litchfieldia salsa TaxID=930152 RepID=A0A1H0UT19_9BACI|nr:winged helix DNA-binding protein [Litchfieldia salsa]SDP69342.1 DNA-binding transcriptional regulator, MarR family [Litchfieldia salsa]